MWEFRNGVERFPTMAVRLSTRFRRTMTTMITTVINVRMNNFPLEVTLVRRIRMEVLVPVLDGMVHTTTLIMILPLVRPMQPWAMLLELVRLVSTAT